MPGRKYSKPAAISFNKLSQESLKLARASSQEIKAQQNSELAILTPIFA